MLKKIKNMMGKKEQNQEKNNPDMENDILQDENTNDGEGQERVDQLAEKEEEIATLKDKYLRLQAEFDNFRKRSVKEKLDFMSTASRNTIEALLPVLDDFDRAKKNAMDDSSTEVFSEGVNLVYAKLYKNLEQKGLKEMVSTGEAFDSELHEAVTEIPAPNEELKGKVIDTLEKGYFLNDKIIRHAKVVVGK